jgi:uncharacterized membrane protein
LTTIDAPGAFFTRAFGINNRGDIVGHYRDAAALHGFLLHKVSFTPIQITLTTEALGINSEGDIVGGYSDATGTHGFLTRIVSSDDSGGPEGDGGDSDQHE